MNLKVKSFGELKDYMDENKIKDIGDVKGIGKSLANEMMSQFYRFTDDAKKKLEIKVDGAIKTVDNLADEVDNRCKNLNDFCVDKVTDIAKEGDKITEKVISDIKHLIQGEINIAKIDMDKMKVMLTNQVKVVNGDMTILSREIKDKHDSIIGFFNKIEQGKAEAIEKIKNADQIVAKEIDKIEDKLVEKALQKLTENFWKILLGALKRLILRR